MRLKEYLEGSKAARPEYGFVDLHGHLIPAVDDGPRSLAEALELLRGAHRHSTRQAVATPHAFTSKWGLADPAEVVKAFTRFRRQLQARKSDPRYRFLDSMAISAGAENKVCPRFQRALQKRRVMTLNGSRYVLTEFHSYRDEGELDGALGVIWGAGLIPVLAHPERLVSRRRCRELFPRLARDGCLFQLNAPSLSGTFGPEARRNALHLLRHLPQSCLIASDGHRPRTRPLKLLDTWRNLSQEYSAQQVRNWMHLFPSRILLNQDLKEGRELDSLPQDFPQAASFP
ncbi:MAG TPA: CpsB/CapC family capsule biosynthesis tyrosine phosphatase [Acidobacteriota bacterium]|nr:CpsB/CapC family capsule biosynthesis tyrosine phosphatase [Acidobacteriota bacterium]